VISAAPAHVVSITESACCRRDVELECEGLQGFWGYETYNEYFCPYCRKQNHERTSGAVVSARAPPAEGVRGNDTRHGGFLVPLFER
jgi:hypothetical protein